MGELVNVVAGAVTLPALFAPNEKAARRTVEFFTANNWAPVAWVWLAQAHILAT